VCKSLSERETPLMEVSDLADDVRFCGRVDMPFALSHFRC
jgi:hypothetical protein